jgi:hypothetical protein
MKWILTAAFSARKAASRLTLSGRPSPTQIKESRGEPAIDKPLTVISKPLPLGETSGGWPDRPGLVVLYGPMHRSGSGPRDFRRLQLRTFDVRLVASEIHFSLPGVPPVPAETFCDVLRAARPSAAVFRAIRQGFRLCDGLPLSTHAVTPLASVIRSWCDLSINKTVATENCDLPEL